MLDAITNFLGSTGIAQMFSANADTVWWKYLAMYVLIGGLFYLAIVKKFEPLLLMPIAFGMLLANLPGTELIHLEYFFDDYYIAVEDGQFVGTLSMYVKGFVESFLGNYSELFTLTEDSFNVNMSFLVENGVDPEYIVSRCNVNGGAIALGHPVGASGNRIIVTLAHELKHSGKTYGVASLCIGGGMGTAVVLKNI